MTNLLSVVVGVVAGVVIGVVAGVATRVGVELRLRLWKLSTIDDVRLQRVSIFTPCSSALATPASPLPPMGHFGSILRH